MFPGLWLKFRLLICLLAVMIGVHAVNMTLDGQLIQYGIIPRSEEHWFHVFISPFIHVDHVHLLNNLFGLAIFSVLCLMRSVGLYILCSIFVITSTGLLVWLFARSAIHLGASGWIFGLWSFAIAIAWFDRKLINIVSSFLVVFLYGGMIYGVLPSDPNVSFEAHLFGALSGALFAFFYSVYVKATRRSQSRSSVAGN